ncbi:MAG TPA: exodeoxyribonuclease VII large subunit [Terracidiphilus sp.]|nr:exodeoxyribonuclease VII large subunit [Terracidiphilus sp.]
MPVRRIWPVRELVEEMRDLVERQFPDVWVEGEVSNLRIAPSGHLYFTLKDADAQLPVVIFRRQAMLLRFNPEDGLHVLARGKVSVYGQRGQLQLVAEALEPVGAGSLQLAFEQLKERLKGEGLFDADRKQALPTFPRGVGIITSPAGAVIQDFLNIVSRRHSGLNVLLFPVTVQGDSAPAEIEAAISALNTTALVDVIVIARGGGSLEDLAPFNSERVARAISASKLPVVSAIGHETDFTIADFVADLRAPTPSAAAELITEAQHKVAERVILIAQRLERATRYQLLHAREHFQSVHPESTEWRMTALLNRLSQRLDDCTFRIEAALAQSVHDGEGRLARLVQALMHHDPGRQISAARERLSSGRIHLDRAIENSLRTTTTRLHSLAAQLHALSPLAVLDRGYALVQSSDGILIRSIAQVDKGELISARFSDGSIASRVEEKLALNHTERRKTRKT